jgi:hypothetical protein
MGLLFFGERPGKTVSREIKGPTILGQRVFQAGRHPLEDTRGAFTFCRTASPTFHPHGTSHLR